MYVLVCRARAGGGGCGCGAAARAVHPGAGSIAQVHRGVSSERHLQALAGARADGRGRRRDRASRADDPEPGRETQAPGVQCARADREALGGPRGNGSRGRDLPGGALVPQGPRLVRAQEHGDADPRDRQTLSGARAAHR